MLASHEVSWWQTVRARMFEYLQRTLCTQWLGLLGTLSQGDIYRRRSRSC